MPTAKVSVPAPKAATKPSITSTIGTITSVSLSVSATVATSPPRHAAKMPMLVPMVKLAASEAAATPSESTAPCASRVSVSRPNWSVPSGCASDMGAKRCAKSILLGSYGLTSSTSTISSAISSKPPSGSSLPSGKRRSQHKQRGAALGGVGLHGARRGVADIGRCKVGRRKWFLAGS